MKTKYEREGGGFYALFIYSNLVIQPGLSYLSTLLSLSKSTHIMAIVMSA
jgi:hypothetical protein